MLDGGGFQPCFVYPQMRERKTQSFELKSVVELGDHGFQSLVLQKEDHGCHCRWGETTIVLVDGTLVVVVECG